jgi:hypothetical protein
VTSGTGAVTGRDVVDGDTPFPSPLSKLSVRPLPVERDTAVSMAGIPDNGRVRDDGSFELKSVVGQVRLTVAPLADGWAIRQIDHNGRDLTSQPFETAGQTLEGFVITLTNRFPTVSGTLHDAKGNAVLEGSAIVFPEDSSLWLEDLRAIRIARVDQSGVFTIKGLRPGKYLCVAVASPVNNQWNDPEYIESLREAAKPITLEEGETKRIVLVVKSVGGQ